jgi:hypothetical protein
LPLSVSASFIYSFRPPPGRVVMISEPLHESFPVPIGMYSERFMA